MEQRYWVIGFQFSVDYTRVNYFSLICTWFMFTI